MNETSRRGELPPIILVGGDIPAWSAALHLSRIGVTCYSLNKPTNPMRYSRNTRWIELPAGDKIQPGDKIQDIWLDWLEGEGARRLPGAVVMPCNDDALEMVAHHRSRLAPHYIVSEANDQVLLAMLDKQQTYDLGKKTGVLMPKIWSIASEADLARAHSELLYPCALKPRHSHKFQKHFSDLKLMVVRDEKELHARFEVLFKLGLEVLLTEIIPGGDERFCSYYTYLDEHGQPLFHFTKRKPREYPVDFGTGTFHITDWNPEVAETALRFLQGVGVRGIGNVEFKRDPRDNQLKFIECNSRFTNSHQLIENAGVPFAELVYNRLTGRPLPVFGEYRRGLKARISTTDILACHKYWQRGDMTLMQWLGALVSRDTSLRFHWSDPIPGTILFLRFFRSIWDVWVARPLSRAFKGRTAKAA